MKGSLAVFYVDRGSGEALALAEVLTEAGYDVCILVVDDAEEK